MCIYKINKSTMENIDNSKITRNDIIHANSYFIDEYFKDLIFNIRRFDRKKNIREKDFLSNCEPPKICCCKYEDIDVLTDFANEIAEKIGLPVQDICIATLMAFYSISALEHDEFVDYGEIIKKAKYTAVTSKVYLAICGIGTTTKSMNAFDKKTIELDYDCKLFKKMRRYMMTGVLEKKRVKQEEEKTCCVYQ